MFQLGKWNVEQDGNNFILATDDSEIGIIYDEKKAKFISYINILYGAAQEVLEAPKQGAEAATRANLQLKNVLETMVA